VGVCLWFQDVILLNPFSSPVPKSEPDSDNSRNSGNSDSDSSRKSENIVHAGRGLRNAAELADVVEAAL